MRRSNKIPHLAEGKTAAQRDAALADAGLLGDAQPPPRFPPPPELREDFARIVHAIYDAGVDVVAEYEVIEQALHVHDPLNPGSLKVAMARGEDMARRAYRLYLLARYEYEAYLRQTDVLVGAVREAARSNLERDKAGGLRTKQITDADVIGEAAVSYRDEWEDICSRRERAKGMLDMVEKLAALAERRCFTVAKLVDPGPRL